MGSVVGGLLGGSKGSSSSGGFSALPAEIQGAWKDFGSALQGVIPTAGQAYTPMGFTGDENRAFDMLRKGFAPTADSLKADVGMLMNPFDQFVMDDINRAAASDFSILKQNMNQAGQFGSNRQMLGANDIEQTRLGTLGKFRQDQYNKSIEQIFNNLIPTRAADAAGLLSVGNMQRGLDTAQRTAPIVGLQEIAAALGILPKVEGSSSSQSSSSDGIGGLLGSGGAGGAIKAIGSLFSDRSLKENIRPAGKENGHNVYEFNYKGNPKKFIGVMADEVQKTNPEAIGKKYGYQTVDYGLIGVRFREA